MFKNINPISIIFLQVIFLAFVSIPYIILFDNAEIYFTWAMRKLTDYKYVYYSYFSVFYSFFTMYIIYRFLKIDKFIEKYSRKKIVEYSSKTYLNLWVISTSISFFILLYLIVSAGGYPPIMSFGLSQSDFGQARFDLSHINKPIIYQFGLKVSCFMSVVISFFFLKSYKSLKYKIISILMLVLMGAFSLHKSGIVMVLIGVLMFQMLVQGISFRSLNKYIVISVVFILMMSSLSGYSSDFSSFLVFFGNRVLLGQLLDLPYYFQLFDGDSVSFSTLVSPKLISIFGFDPPIPASQLVSQYLNDYSGRYGSASTYFTGEAFAVFGVFGVIISPFVVMFNIILVVIIFVKIKKNIFTVFFFAFFILKYMSLFSSFGYFVLSSTQILFLASLFVVFIVSFFIRKY